MGFHQGLTGESYDRNYSNKTLLARIWVYARPYKKLLFSSMVIVIFQAIMGALPPVLVSKVLDNTLSVSPSFNVFILLVSAVLFIEVMGFVFYYLLRRNMVRIIGYVIRDLTVDAFAASLRQDLAFHDNFSSGRIVSRITTDSEDFSMLIRLTTDVLTSVLQSVVTAIILFRTEWRLALAVIAFVPIVVLIVASYRKLARKVTTRGMRAMANVNATIKETISGISIAKNFRQEEAIYQEFQTSNKTSYQVNVKRGLVLSIVFPTMRTLGGITIALMVYFGSLTVMQGLITAGAWYLILLASDRFLMPVLSITSYWTQVQTGLSAAERIFALIDSEHSVNQTDSLEIKDINGKIDFNNLNFKYSTGVPVLTDFDLHIKPGENIAIVGHTGAGKSSIARLVARFYEFQEGDLFIDDVDIREYDLNSLRLQMGIVNQVPFLFEGTIEENIRFSKPDITREEILELAQMIGNGEWLETFSNGLDTQVGERGAQISMGQRQLVALMRILVHKPSIFILDEATASIDPFTEHQIQQALNLILNHSTSILIAHRLSTVKSADRIIVLDHGKIVEEGTHDQLLATSGHYASLYNTYFRHQSLEYVEEIGEFLKDV
ncbi:MAG: ABC transporter ATP-binding protein [Chloroflexi bacterium]|jgi:ATP-binding cassette subfamily B protein|nr:ABC transporter ATP-binding protein [Chloroflexota bacterium]